MAHAGGQIGKGVRFAFSASSPVSWTKVPEIIEAAPQTFQAADVEITTNDTVGKLEKKISGLISVGDVTVTCLGDFNETNVPAYEALANANIAGTTLWFRLEIPCGTLWKAFEWQGDVKSVNYRSPIGGRQEIEFVISFSGNSVARYAAGASAIS